MVNQKPYIEGQTSPWQQKKQQQQQKNKRTNDNLQNATQIDQHEPTLNTVGELRYSGRRRI